MSRINFCFVTVNHLGLSPLALRILTVRDILRHLRALTARASKAYQIPCEAKLTREENAYLLSNKNGDLTFF